MELKLHYDQLLVGLVASLAITVVMARMTYDSGQRIWGFFSVILFEAAMIWLFVKLHKLYFQVRSRKDDGQSGRDFNRKALAFNLMNLLPLVFVMTVFAFSSR